MQQISMRSAALAAAAAAAAVAAVTLHKIVQRINRNRHLPPGPPSLPIIGSHLSIDKTFRKWIVEDSKAIYGKLCCFSSQGSLMLAIHDFDLMQEALILNGNHTSGRINSAFSRSVHRHFGVLSSDGDDWRQLRRLSLQWLRDLGFGKSAGQSYIAAEAESLCEQLRNRNGDEIDTADPFNRSISNVICQLVFGRRLGSEESNFEQRLREISAIAQHAPQRHSTVYVFVTTILLSTFTQLTLRLSHLNRLRSMFQSLYDYCQSHIDAKRSNLQSGNSIADPNDYIEAFVASAADGQHSFSDLHLQVAITDLFVAGTDTTANSLRWMALHVAIDENLQQRLYEQIQSVIGNRTVNMQDKQQLPLIESFLHELQRFYTLVPLAVTHRTTQQIQLNNYIIPKDTLIQPNIMAVHFDESIFENANQFIADRFIDSNGKFVANSHVIPFGIGRRSCLGETLARSELFIFTVTLLQNFRIHINPNDLHRIDEICEYAGGVVHAPARHSLIFNDRSCE